MVVGAEFMVMVMMVMLLWVLDLELVLYVVVGGGTRMCDAATSEKKISMGRLWDVVGAVSSSRQ